LINIINNAEIKMSTPFPDVVLPAPYVAQQPYQSDTVKITSIEDNVAGRSLKAFTQLGDNPSFKYWVDVMNGDAYTENWTNEDVSNAVLAYFTALES
jgi:hypothetical protein